MGLRWRWPRQRPPQFGDCLPLGGRRQHEAARARGGTGGPSGGRDRREWACGGGGQGSDHHNLAIVYRSAEGDSTKLPALAAELVALPVAVIAANGPAVAVAKAATTTI